MKTYIAVPYPASHRAKALGARWDMARKSWYVPDGVDLAKFSEWLPGELRAWFGSHRRKSKRKQNNPVPAVAKARPRKKKHPRKFSAAEVERRLDRKALRKLRWHGIADGAA